MKSIHGKKNMAQNSQHVPKEKLHTRYRGFSVLSLGNHNDHTTFHSSSRVLDVWMQTVVVQEF